MVTSPPARPAPRWLPLLALVVLALSLRAPISSLGGVLSEVQDTLNLSAATAGLLTTLPVLFFAAVGLGAARAISRVGLHRATIAVLLVMTTASLLRATTGRPVVLIAATALLLAAIAVGNVLLPALAKRHYPHRLASVSSLYGAAVIGGSSLGALAAGVLSSGPGWRAALLATAAVPVVGLLLWAPALRRDRGVATGQVHLPVTSMLRSRRAWALAGCFGLVCAQAYAQLGHRAIEQVARCAGRSSAPCGSARTSATTWPRAWRRSPPSSWNWAHRSTSRSLPRLAPHDLEPAGTPPR
jgi:CP family cyanate transporter-like MFS transporter